MSEKVANVIIIGGGPAGASTAILCRNFGLKVGLVEAVAYPRFAPGEALPCGIEAYFDSLGVTEQLHAKPVVTYEGTKMQWGNEAEAFVAGFGEDDSGIRRRGLQIPRHHLDTVLLEKARSVGVAILQPCVVKGMFAQKGRICGVVTNQGNFGADFIIDAAGSRHWMARKLRLELKYHSPPLFGSYGWATGELPDYELPRIIADPKGWTWTSRVDEGLYQFTRCTFQKEELPSIWLPDELKGLTPQGRVRGADLTWRRVVHPAGPGFFLAGDALCRTDPVVQQGVFKSLVCGFKVALMLDQIYNDGRPEEEARAEYCRWVEETYLSDLGLLRTYYERHPHAPEWIKQMDAPVVKRPEQPLLAL